MAGKRRKCCRRGGAFDAGKMLQMAGKVAKKNKLASKAAKAMGFPMVAKVADMFGFGRKKRRCGGSLYNHGR